jgi:hypothetical protein
MRIKTGTVEGTGSAISMDIGFIPQKVQLINIDGDALLEWTEDMGAGKGYKILGTGLGALIATGGITVSAETSTYIGFSIGADTDVNVTAETIVYTAWPATY